MTISELFCPSYGTRVNLPPKPPNCFSEGPKVVPNLGKFFLSRNVMRPIKLISENVLNTKMYVVGAKNRLFFQGSKW